MGEVQASNGSIQSMMQNTKDLFNFIAHMDDEEEKEEGDNEAEQPEKEEVTEERRFSVVVKTDTHVL